MRPINLTNTSPDYGFEVPPCSRLDLLLFADSIHRALDYDGSGPFPIMTFLENTLPRVYEDFVLEIVPEGALGDKFGETFPAQHLIKLPEDIYNKAIDGDGFSRMTVAHEIAHLLWHGDVPVSLARRRADKTLPAYRTSEWQANALGGSILMPIESIVSLEPEEIKEKYQVSITAASVQRKKVQDLYVAFTKCKREIIKHENSAQERRPMKTLV